jgi:hypothetical protein
LTSIRHRLTERKFAKVISAINEVYGMGIDLATVLALMGTVWTGDPLSLDPSFSIGGRDTGVNNLLNNLGGILGTDAFMIYPSPFR